MKQPAGHEIIVEGAVYVKVSSLHRLMNPNLFDCQMCGLLGKKSCREADCIRGEYGVPCIYVKKLEADHEAGG